MHAPGPHNCCVVAMLMFNWILLHADTMYSSSRTQPYKGFEGPWPALGLSNLHPDQIREPAGRLGFRLIWQCGQCCSSIHGLIAACSPRVGLRRSDCLSFHYTQPSTSAARAQLTSTCLFCSQEVCSVPGLRVGHQADSQIAWAWLEQGWQVPNPHHAQ